MCETPSVAVVIIDAGSLFAEGLDLEIAAILVSKNQSKSIQQFLCPVIAVLWKNCENWCQSHLWQSPLTALVLPMAGAAQPKNFIVKIRNYNTMAPTGQHDWYWLRWGAGGRALTSWFPWSTLTNPASTTTGWRPHLGSSRRSNRNPSICFLTIRLPELFG